MRDPLDPTATRGLWWRVPVLIAVLVFTPPMACVAAFNARHPAPLGRSREAILAYVDGVLPPGTTIDSAERYLKARGVRVKRYAPADAERAFYIDTLLAGGPVPFAIQPATTRGIYVWNAFVTLYFGPGGRLVRRDALLSAESPL